MTYDGLCGAVRALDTSPHRGYALLVPVVEREEELSLLFERRAPTLHTQPGEVCFPGGAVEPGESPAQAALRETEEELGLRPPLVDLGPPLPPARHQAGFLLRPFLGRLAPGWEKALSINRDEVAEVFTVPLDFFRTTPPERYVCQVQTVPPPDFPHVALGFPQGYPWRRGEVSVPVWRWEDRPIWGITARVVLSLVGAL